MEYHEIKNPEDVTEDHIAEAVDLRSGLYGGVPASWFDTIAHIESSQEDWGSDMDSLAIKHLQKEVRKRLRDQ